MDTDLPPFSTFRKIFHCVFPTSWVQQDRSNAVDMDLGFLCPLRRKSRAPAVHYIQQVLAFFVHSCCRSSGSREALHSFKEFYCVRTALLSEVCLAVELMGCV